MKFTQKLLSFASAVGILASASHAQTSALAFSFTGNSTANYRQLSSGVFFEGANFSFTIRDGNFVYDGCEAPFFYNPSVIPPCPIGATGFVSRGLDGDPLLAGLGPYFSVTEIAPAVILQPFDALGARLVAAPPSLLPRPQLGFQDLSLSVFYNLRTDFIRQFPITSYDFQRGYTAAERSRFDGEVVPGTYKFNFSALTNSFSTIKPPPVNLSINLFPKLDGFRKINNQPQGFRFLNAGFDAAGFAVLDPFAINTLKWEGNSVNFISPQADIAYLSIKRLVNPIDPLSEPDLTAVPLFPSFSGPNVSRVLLTSPLVQEFILAPNFLRAGDTGLVDVEFVITRPTSNLINERATRRFRLPVKVLNPFASAIRSMLPPGTTSAQLASDFDYDGDGVTNFSEWVFGSDPSSASSVPGTPGVIISTTSTGGGATGPQLLEASVEATSTTSLEYRVPKLTNTVPKLNYAIEFSTDMVKWNEIKADDPAWSLVETYNELKVTSNTATPTQGGFFRAKVQSAE